MARSIAGALRQIKDELNQHVTPGLPLDSGGQATPDLAAAGLEQNDVVLYPSVGYYDHLPIVVDFCVSGLAGDWDADGLVTGGDVTGLDDALQGPGIQQDSCGERIFDADGDSDVDILDVAVLQVQATSVQAR